MIGAITAARESSILKRVVAVAGGNSLAQIIVLLFAPIITRIYSPEVFGLQGVFLAAVSLLAPVVALRFPMAIIVAEDELEIRTIERLSWVTAIVVSGIVLLSIFVFTDAISRLFRLESIGILIYLLPLALLMTAFHELSNYKAARRERFRAISITAAAQSLLNNGAKALAGLFAPIGTTLVILATIGPGIHAAMLSLSDGHRRRVFDDEAGKSLRAIGEAARKYRDFATMRMPTDLLNAATLAAPVLLLGIFFGPFVAGLYTLAKSVLTLPSNVVGNAIGTVFYAHFAELAREGQPVTRLAAKSSLILLLGPGLLIVVSGFFAPDVFAVAFGEEWREAGTYAKWMVVWTAVALANVPSVRLAPVIQCQGALLAANVVMLITRAGSIFLAFNMSSGALGAVAIYSIVSAAGNLGLVFCILLLAKQYDRRTFTGFRAGDQGSEESRDDE